MKKLIEIFNWKHEGEYDQYFFIVDDEKTFIRLMMYHLNNVRIKEEYPWSESLSDYQEHKQIEPYFLLGDIPHLRETYYIDFGYRTGFTLSKRTLDYKSEEIK